MSMPIHTVVMTLPELCPVPDAQVLELQVAVQSFAAVPVAVATALAAAVGRVDDPGVDVVDRFFAELGPTSEREGFGEVLCVHVCGAPGRGAVGQLDRL